MGIIKKIFGSKKEEKSDSELKADVLKKATENWNANKEPEPAASEKKAEGTAFEINDKVKKKNIHTVLLEIADKGEMGALPISISDKTGINQQDTSTALAFLTKEQYVEEVNSATGFKYYLTAAGKKYCISKEFNCD